MDRQRLAELDAMATEGRGFDWRLVLEMLEAVRDGLDSDDESRHRTEMLLGVAGDYEHGVPKCIIREILETGCRPMTPVEADAMDRVMRSGASARKSIFADGH